MSGGIYGMGFIGAVVFYIQHSVTFWMGVLGFAKAIFAARGMAVDLSPCTTVDYPTPAQRPAYSVLDGTRRRSLGADLMPPWLEALEEAAGGLP